MRMKRAQSLIEYAILMIVVAAAIGAISAYFRNSVNAKIQEVRTEFTP